MPLAVLRHTLDDPDWVFEHSEAVTDDDTSFHRFPHVHAEGNMIQLTNIRGIRLFTAAIATSMGLAVTAYSQPPQKMQIRNDAASASASITSGGFFGSVFAFSASGSDGTPISRISVDLCSYNPDWEHRYCIYADGQAAAGAISSRGFDFVQVELANIGGFYGFVLDCTSGMCTAAPLPAVALHGIWTRYTGDYSFDYEQSGTTGNVGRYPGMMV